MPAIVAGQANTTVMLADVDSFDPSRSTITLTANGAIRRHVDFDYLVVAAGQS